MFDLAEIRRLLDAFEQSDWDEVHLSADGVEVHIGTGELPTSAPAASTSSEPADTDRVPPATAARAASEPAAETSTPADTDAAGDEDAEAPPPTPANEADDLSTATAIVSPSPGIFWR
ncbi:MAG: hypothetical protein JOZ07_15385 [Solirubrobacterales bacterium]|nr:hypothetical protein [Solirubrobacterales bacterium]